MRRATTSTCCGSILGYRTEGSSVGPGHHREPGRRPQLGSDNQPTAASRRSRPTSGSPTGLHGCSRTRARFAPSRTSTFDGITLSSKVVRLEASPQHAPDPLDPQRSTAARGLPRPAHRHALAGSHGRLPRPVAQRGRCRSPSRTVTHACCISRVRRCSDRRRRRALGDHQPDLTRERSAVPRDPIPSVRHDLGQPRGQGVTALEPPPVADHELWAGPTTLRSGVRDEGTGE
jgi:hypothetical protein